MQKVRCMRPCTVCNHRQRDEIERALLQGESERAVSKRFEVSAASVHRHKAHVRTQLSKTANNHVLSVK
jgi:transposase